MKLILILLLLIGCRTPTYRPDPETFWELSLKAEGKQCYGFIADYHLYTVQHLCKELDILSSCDLKDLGIVSIKGLEICKEHHLEDDNLYYTKDKDIVNLKIAEETDFVYICRVSPGIKLGDSGSPIFCTEHNKVTGIVSGFIGTPKKGIVTKLK